MIVVDGLTKRYGRRTVVDRLSFTVRPGTVTGFLGPNGAGKSTTMRMIVGLDRPDAGRVLIEGARYDELPHPSSVVGTLLDAGWVRPTFTARTHLRWMASLTRTPPERADEVLEAVGLAPVARKRVGDFSLGMRQRLGIATALLGRPHVLLLDEPMNGLDPEGIHWVRRFLRESAAEGRTVLVSSHLLAEMTLTADELVVIGEGRLIAQGGVREFIEEAVRPSVVVRALEAGRFEGLLRRLGLDVRGAPDGTLNIAGVSSTRIGEIALEHGFVLSELRTDHGSLEEAFMERTREAVEYRSSAGAVPQGGAA
ncbi:ABC transporter ATP-binding protein [Actinomadura terrae]|uniref:ABC transporter ATP-binding protein n=1 Tax=Actinomadura terrae TaxID=604353 RepID=UPI001FA7C728|nr:ABC transporter ATP-binding protein [Actinomadura terrae]